MILNEVTILLPENEAKKWILFQKYYDTFSILADQGILEQKNAAVTLHFDKNGILQTVQRADFLYSRRHVDKGI